MNPQFRRSLLDFGPLVAFFAAYRFFGLYAATATVMVAAVAAALLGYLFDRKLHPVPLITAGLVLVFGGLTLYLQDPTFIKMKPTILYGMFAVALIGGLFFGRPLTKYVFGSAIVMADSAWRILTWRFGGLFIGLSALNELIWRNFPENFWVNFHTFGATALILIFSFTQVPFLMKHQIEQDGSDPADKNGTP